MTPTTRFPARRSCAPVALALVTTTLLMGCSQQVTPPPPLPAEALGLEQPLPSAGQSALRVASIGAPSGISVPGSARVGAPVEVTVTTYGGGCIAEDTTVVEVRGHFANVVPFQRVYAPKQNEGCTMELRVNPRHVQVVFTQPGSATVFVFGRVAPDGSLAMIPREIVVE